MRYAYMLALILATGCGGSPTQPVTADPMPEHVPVPLQDPVGTGDYIPCDCLLTEGSDLISN